MIMSTLTELVRFGQMGLGSQGETVRQLQDVLAKLGYPLRGSGYFGGATDTAVSDFQRAHGLTADGVVGPKSAAALDAAVAALSPAGAAALDNRPVQPNPAAADASLARPLWVTEAVNWLNTKETPGSGDNQQILDWAREEGGDIARSYTHDSIPWCALFANMILYKVGLKGTGTLWALDFATWGVPLGGATVGAFAPMKRDGGGHIAVVVGRDQRGNLMCIGGNQGDEVSIRPFPADRPVGFRFPQGVPIPVRTGFSTLPVISSDGHVSTHEA
jgi:uncharacterized protein (TIGR02594 family)